MRVAPLVALAFLAACQDPDVGQACPFKQFTSVNDQPVAADWMETGNTDCVNLVCMKSPVPAGVTPKHNPYCSKACVSDRDCYHGETGLTCRQVVLDPDFIASLPPDIQQKYLGDVQFSNYCALPLP